MATLIKQLTELRAENEGLKMDLAVAEDKVMKAAAAARVDAMVAQKRIELAEKEMTPYRQYRDIKDAVERTVFWNANANAIKEDQRRIFAELQKKMREAEETEAGQ